MRCSLHVFLESYLSIPYWLTGALVIVWTLMVSFVFQIPCIIFFQYMYIFFELYGILCHIEIFNLYLFLFWFLLSLRLFCSNPPKLLILWFWNVNTLQFSSVQFSCSVMSDTTPWTTARQASLSINISWSPPKPMSIKSVMSSNHFILCCPFLLPPSIFPSIRVFSNESVLHIRWPKYWSFSFNISPSNEQLGLISFRMDWLDLLAVQGTLKSSPTPHFKSINSSALSFLHSPALTSIRDHWKNHSLD